MIFPGKKGRLTLRGSYFLSEKLLYRFFLWWFVKDYFQVIRIKNRSSEYQHGHPGVSSAKDVSEYLQEEISDKDRVDVKHQRSHGSANGLLQSKVLFHIFENKFNRPSFTIKSDDNFRRETCDVGENLKRFFIVFVDANPPQPRSHLINSDVAVYYSFPVNNFLSVFIKVEYRFLEAVFLPRCHKKDLCIVQSLKAYVVVITLVYDQDEFGCLAGLNGLCHQPFKFVGLMDICIGDTKGSCAIGVDAMTNMDV